MYLYKQLVVLVLCSWKGS